MAKSSKGFSPEKYSVLIPYRDLVRLLNAAAKMEEMERHMKRIEERSAAMQLLYSEILEKVTEFNRYI